MHYHISLKLVQAKTLKCSSRASRSILDIKLKEKIIKRNYISVYTKIQITEFTELKHNLQCAN